MPLPKRYLKSAEGSIASYDWTDIASGTGYVTLYGTGANLSSGTPVYLIDEAFYGSGQCAEGTTTLDLSVFNISRIIRGKAHIDFWLNKNTSDIHTVTMKFQKVSDTTTDISSAIATPNITATGFSHHNLVIDIAYVKFKKGDKLRLHVVVSAGGGVGYIPLGPTGSYPMVLGVPFKIDL